jgi:adenylate kinase
VKRLVFLGPPGSGKGTQGQLLAADTQIPHISTGDMLREAIAHQTELGQKAQVYMDKGELVPDELLLGLVKERISQEDAQQGWILDGFPRNVDQASFLHQLVSQDLGLSYSAIYLEVPDSTLIQRLLGRGRKDDNQETIQRRLEVYREQTEPVIDFYRKQNSLYQVNGDQTLEQVSSDLRKIVND